MQNRSITCALHLALYLALSLSPTLAANLDRADASLRQPLKSKFDQKHYRYLVLDNQMQVLLVSDADADRAGAALAVQVGSGSDPQEWPGLAHFLEHMLFLGNDKYPQADEYQDFMSANGGSHNAYTALDHTNYFFSLPADKLHAALQRFARFFIDPTFDPTYVDRERAVVHSEYQARFKDEARRIAAANKAALNPDHPAARFSVGSLQTLRDRSEATARQKLIEFYHQYYSANLMQLAVVGNQSLPELEQWVRALFAAVPNRRVSAPQFTQPYFDPDRWPARINIVPDKQLQSVSFQFAIPSTKADYLSKPAHYIADLLGHEGEGSLFALLQSLGWAEALGAGINYLDEVQGVFSVSIDLTEAGLEQVDQIAALLFAKLDQIKHDTGTAWRYDEQRRLSDLAFEYAQEADPGTVARSLAARLQHYLPQDVLRGPYVMQHFDRALIDRVLSQLRADNLLLSVVARPQTNTTTRYAREEFYEVEYALAKIPQRQLDRWQQPKPQHAAQLALPAANPFIPARLALLPLKHPTDKPQRLTTSPPNNPGVIAYYRGDQSFHTPRAEFYFSVQSPPAAASAAAWVMTALYVRLLNEQLNQHTYPAHLAGLNYSLYRHRRGFSVRISGYQDKQPLMLQNILQAIESTDWDAARLAIAKAEFARDLRNAPKAVPSEQGFQELYRLLLQPYWDEAAQLAALPTIDIAVLQQHAARLRAAVSLRALAHGDVSAEQAAEMVAAVQATFADAEWVAEVAAPRIRKLPRGKHYLRTLNIEHTDHLLTVYFQASMRNVAERARMLLLSQLLESAYYSRLRTTERAGYLVYATGFNLRQVPGLVLSVQSPSHSPAALEQLNRAFLDAALDLDTLSEPQKFADIKHGLLAQLHAKDKRLSDRANRYWREIDQKQFDFAATEQLARAIEALSLPEMRAFYTRLIFTEPRQLSIQSVGRTSPPNHPGATPAALGGEAYQVLADVGAFRQQHTEFFATE